MKEMRGLRQIAFLAMAFIGAEAMQAQGAVDTLQNVKVITLPDTIVRTDTIVIREVIERTDVVHRTEKVIRYEEKKTGSSEGIIISEPRIVTDGMVSPAVDAQERPQTTIEAPASVAEETSPGNREYYKYADGSILSVEQGKSPVVSGSEKDGNFIWVPDSLDTAVMNLLNGKRYASDNKPRKGKDEFDPNEKVVFRGDTLPMTLKSRNLGRYDRGLFNFLYTPKGIWQVGATASYGEFSTADLQILDLVSDIDFYGHIFSVKPYFSYFFKNNVSLGLRLGYTEGKAHIGAFNVDIDEDMSFDLHDIMYRSQNYSASVTLTQFLGITRKGRFGVFNEVELALGGGSSDFHRPYNGELRKTHTKVFEAGLNFSPGISVYILEQLSFNVSFGVFGLNIKNEKQTVDDEPMGSRTTSGANFRFNIFNINFGIAVNI